MSGLNDLISTIRSRSALISEEFSDNRTDLSELFIRSIKKTLREIHHGADSDDFSDLVVVNLIMMGAETGYSADEMRVFVLALKADSDSDILG